MTWQSLGTITLTNEWTLTTPVNGEIFRIRHHPTNNPDNRYLKAVISPSFNDDGINLYSPQLLTYREEKEILSFFFPSGITAHSLGFRRTDKSNIQWMIDVDVFASTNQSDDFANYIKTRFSDLFSGMVQQGSFTRASLARPIGVISVVDQSASVVLAESITQERKSVFIVNDGDNVAYFKYVRLSNETAAATNDFNVLDADFTLLPDERMTDDSGCANQLIVKCGMGKATTIRATEYLYFVKPLN